MTVQSGASNATATIRVTIYVIDVDEDLTIKNRAEPTVESPQTVDYPENGTGSVATFTASDPEGASPIVWSLGGDDAGDFTINGGVLNFKASPDYADNGDNTYMVTVQASVGDEIASFVVTVNVTDVDEDGTVTWNVGPGGSQLTTPRALRQFQPGAVLAAMVTDPDSDNITGITWKWYRSSDEIAGAGGTGANGASYTVKEADVGMRIRATATYQDGNGPEESASFTSEAPVQAARAHDGKRCSRVPDLCHRWQKRLRRTATGNTSEGRSRPRTPIAATY